MRPTEISIDGFRSYRAGRPATVDFRKLKTAAIVGDTGAGKSSILEALTWALFGEISSGAKVLQQVMNDNADRMNVRLAFETKGRRFTVRRGARRTKKGTVVADGVLLTETLKDTGSGEATLAEGANAVLRKVRELIGMNCDAFLRTTVLPQGRFSRLLAEDDQAVRAAVLRQIWSTGELDDAQAVAGRATARVRALLLRARQERSGKPENPEVHQAALKDAADAADAAAAGAGEARRRLAEAERAASETLRAAVDAAALYDAAAGAAAELESTRDLPRLRARLAELAERRTTCRGRVERLDAQWAESPWPTDPEALRTHARILEKLESHIALTGEAVSGRTEAAHALPGTRKKCDEATLAAAAAEQELETRRREMEAADSALHDARRALETLAERRRAADLAIAEAESTTRTTIAGAAERLDEVRAEEAANVTAAAELRDEARAAEGTRADADGALADAERRNHAAAAACDAEPDDPCPVCERPLPGEWTAPAALELKTLRDAVGAARTKLESLTGRIARADAAGVEARKTRIRCETEIDGARQRLAGLRRTLAETLELPVDPAEASDEALNRLAATARARLDTDGAAAESRVAELERARTAAADALQAAVTSSALRAHEARTLTADLAAAEKRVHDTLTRLEDLVTTWMALALKASRTRPAGLDTVERTDGERAAAGEGPAGAEAGKRAGDPRTTGNPGIGPATDPATLEPGDTARALAAVKLLRDRIRNLARERDAMQTARLEAREALEAAAAAHDAHRDTAVAPLKALETAIGATVARLAENLHAVEDEGSAPGTAHETAERAAAAARLASERAAAAHTAAAAALDTERRTVPAEHRSDPAGWLETRHDAAVAKAAAARWQLDAFRRQIAAIRELDECVTDAGAKVEQLDELRRNLSGGHFPKYVTLRRSASLLAHASRHLKAMTAERYAFLDPRDTEERWTILDRHTMHTREPNQLSGGEQFLASVALALGAVETVSRIGGRIQTLFIDEGFGALDRQSLRRAIKGIHAASEDRHLIVLVSHVREVAAAADDVIFVELEPDGGSTATTLDERQKLLLTDPEADDAAPDLLGAA